MSIVGRLLGTSGDSPDDIDPLESGLDDVFSVLANSRRRYVIDVVAEYDQHESTSITDLSRGLAFVEGDAFDRLEDVTGKEKKACYVSLYQSHLPKMAETGVIDYDVRTGEVSPNEATKHLQRVVRAGYVEASEMGWSA